MCAGAVHYVVVLAGEVAAVRSFHLDHPGAQIGQSAGGQRGGDCLFDGNDGDPVQRERGVRVHADYYDPVFAGVLG